jgi:RHS repeat-associated protein
MRTWFRGFWRRPRTEGKAKQVRASGKRARCLQPRAEVLEGRILLSLSALPNQPVPTGTAPLDVQLGRIDANNTLDMAILGADGRVTVALNNGDNYWHSVQTTTLVASPADGLALGRFDASQFLSLAVQTPNAITLAHGDGFGHFSVAQTLTPEAPGSLAPSGGGHVQMASADLNGDGFDDLVTVSPGTNEVLVFLSHGGGALTLPAHYASGASQPVAVIAGDFVGDPLLDLAVGHRDGSVTFFQGLPGGTFLPRPDLTVHGLGTITGLAAGNFDGSGTNAIAVSSSTGVTLLTNHHQPPATPIANGSFTDGLAGWTPSGPVTASNGLVQLQENSSTLLTSLQKTFLVPARPTTLSFDLDALNLESPGGGVPDAFEASLLDAGQNSVVPTIAPQATSFFNVNPGSPNNVVSTAAGVTFDGRHVTLDISHLTPNTQATLTFDLVGNPPGTTSVATLANVQVAQQPASETYATTPLAGGSFAAAGIAAGDVNSDGHLDLVATDPAHNQLVVYNGDGAGNFTPSTVSLSAFGAGPAAVAAGPLTAGSTGADVALTLAGSNLALSPLAYAATPPQVTAVTPAAGQLLAASVSQLTVQFSEAVRDAGPTGTHSVSSPAGYTLVNTTTNQTVPLASVSYNAATFQAVLTPAAGSAPLADGVYQLTVKGADPTASIHDLAGDPLGSGQDAVSTFTVDTAPPTATLTLSPNVLWSPNHQLVNIRAQVNAHDPLDPNPSVTLVSIASNEPDTSSDPGDLPNDIQNTTYGTNDLTFSLRAERLNAGTGRVYTVTYLVRDAAGNGRLVSGIVAVPHAPTAGASSITANFNGTAIGAGNTLWFNSVLKPSGLGSSPVTIRFVSQTISFTANGQNYTLAVPDSAITYAPTATTATTTFNPASGTWVSTMPSSGLAGNQFLSALTYPVPANLPGGIQNVTWSGQFLCDTSGVSLNWQWGAAVYTSFGTDYTAVGVKPVDDNHASQYQNSDHAGTPENFKASVIGGATGGGGSNYTGSYSGTGHATPAPSSQAVLALLGNPTPPGVGDLQTATVTLVKNGTAQVGTAIAGAIAQAGEVDVYAFPGTAGQRLFFNAVSGSATALHWFLTDPNGNVLFNTSFQDHDVLTLSTAGTYYLTVDARNGQTGVYQFEVWNVPATVTTSATIGQVLSGTIGVPGQQARYTLGGNAGQRVFVDVQNSAGGALSVTVLNPDGSTLLAASNQNQGNRVTLPVTGPYTVVVGHGGTLSATGPYQFQVDALPADVPQATPLNTPTSGVITVPGQTVSYTFHANLGEAVNFQVLSDPGGAVNFTLLDPSGNTVFANRTGSQMLASLPAGGTYTLVAQAAGDLTGTFQFQVVDQSAIPGPVGIDPPFNVGDIVSGTIATPSQVDTWTFTATAGQHLFFNAQAGNYFWVFWTLTDPSGNVLFRDGLQDEETLAAPATGTYTLTLSSHFGNTGGYQFKVWNVPVNPPVSFNLGDTVSGTLTVPGEEDFYSFSGTAGQRLYLQMINNFGYVFALKTVEVFNPDGSVLFGASPYDRDTFTVATTGTYKIEVDENGLLAATGPYQFKFWVEPPLTPVPIAYNTVVNGNLAVPGEEDQYSFSGTAGDRVFFDVLDNPGFWGSHKAFTLFGPNGATLWGPTTGSVDTLVLPTTGTYTIFVDDAGDIGATGTYQFELFTVPLPTTTSITYNTVVNGNLAVSGEEDYFTFQGTAGDRLFFLMLQNSGFFDSHKAFTLTAPDGSQVWGPTTRSVDTFVLQQTGLYKFFVDDAGDITGTGTYQFELVTVPAPTVTAISFNQAVNGTLAVPGEEDYYTFSATAGQQVFFQLLVDPGFFDSHRAFTLLAPDGSTVWGPARSNVDTVTLPATGTYKIFVDDAGDIVDTGPYEFVVWNVPPTVTTPIAMDQVVSDVLAVPGQRARYTVNGLAGENVFFAVQNDPNDLAFTLLAPDGTAVFASSNRNVGPFLLPQTGTYTIVVAHNTGFFDPIDASGPYQFQLFDIIQPGQPANDVADSKGTNFWLGFPGNLRQDGPFHPEPPPDDELFISADQNTTGNVSIPGTGYYAFFSVQAGTSTTVHLPLGTDTQQGDGIDPFGIHVTSQSEVSVAAVSYLTATTDGFLALPTDVLGTQYLVMAYSGGTLFSGSQVDVVAASNTTTVTITPAVNTNFRTAGVPYTVTLQQGQIYQLRANNPNDLTGTRISSNNPVAVYGGNQACFIPASSHWANYIVDQMLPVSEWGKHFVTEPLATRLKGDLFRILASVDGTNVRINGTVVATLNKGQFYEQQQVTQASEITADQPVLVEQYSYSTGFDGVEPADPSMMTVPSVDQYLSSYTVTTPPTGFSENFVNVTVPAADVGQLTLDGSAVPASSFAAIGSGAYFGAQLSVTVGAHQLAAPQSFGAIAYGYNIDDAYSYPAGFNLAGPVVVAHVALAPKTATDLDGTPATVVATVTDNQNHPVMGFHVAFQVTGANPTTGTAITDANGQAAFTYTGTQPGTDTVQATAATFSDTATVHWANVPPSVSFTSPANGSTLSAGTSVVLTGQALPGSPLAPVVLITVNGTAVDATDPAGDFFAAVNVAAGTNVFTVVATDSLGQAASATLTLTGASGGGLPTGQLSDVTPLGQLTYAATTFNRHTQTLYASATLTDVATVPLAGPLQAVISPFTPSSVALANPAGTEPDGRPYLTFLGGAGAQELAPGGQSAPGSIAFSDAALARFTFGVTLLGPGNAVPQFTSVPVTQAGVGVPYTYQAAAGDADSDVLTFRLPVAPAGMSVDATGKVTWTPTAAQQGLQQVTLVADDGRGGTATQTFTLQASLNPPNQPPVFQSVPRTHADPGTLYTYSPKVSDPDGDTLHFFLDSGPSGMTIDPNTGVVTFQTGAAATFAVKLRVDDGHGANAVQAYVLTVGAGSSDAVTITSTPPASAVVGIAYVYLPTAQDSAGQPLTFALVSGPAGVNVNANTGRVDWTPTAGEVGPETLVLSASDALGGSAVQTFTVTVQPQLPDLPPVFRSAPVGIATQNQPYSYTPQVLEPEGDPVQFTLVLGAPGLNINSATGQLTWTPAAANVGNYTIAIQATDPAGNASFQTFTLSVRPPTVPPTLTTTPVTSVTAGSAYHYLVGATDGPDAFTFSLAQGPAGMVVDPRSGLVTWRPATADLGPHAVDVRLTNERGAVSDQTFTLTVVPDTTAPSVTVVLSTAVTQVGQAVTITVTASDDVAVASYGLTVNGTTVTLDANHSAVYTPTTAAVLAVVGTATDTSGNVGTATVPLRVADPTDTDGPTVQITSPVSGDTLTYLTQVTGTVTDPDLQSYQLDYSPAGSNQWTNFAQGTGPVVNGVLGTFDPTLLENELYDVRVTAQDVSGNVTVRVITVTLDGHAKVGNFQQGATDMTIPVAGGPPIQISRQYDTLQANDSADFGYGWRFCAMDPHFFETVPTNPGERLLGMFAALPFKAGDKLYITSPDCSREGFTFKPVPTTGIFSILDDQFGTIYEPRWVPDPGVTDNLYGEFDRVTINANFTGNFDPVNGLPTPLIQLPDGSFILAYLNASYNPQGFRLVNKDGTDYHYSKFGGLEDITDRLGNVLTVTPDGITSSSGQGVKFVRDAEGRITQITDPANNSTIYQYDTRGNLEMTTASNGLSSHYDYADTPAHYLTDVNSTSNGCTCTPASPPVHVAYDFGGRLKAMVNALGQTIQQQTYNLANDTEQVADALGNLTTYVYDARGNVLQTSDPLGHSVSMTYDTNDDVTAVTDERGNVTHMTYDARRNETSITDALGQVTAVSYDAQNHILSQTDAQGHTYVFDYDTKGNALDVRGPLGISATFTYDTQGRPLSVADASGNTWQMVYGAGPHPIRVIAPDGTSQQASYNIFGDLAGLTDENGNTTTFAYDSSGRIMAILDPLNQAISFTYAGQYLESVTDKSGHATHYAFDAAGHLTQIINAQGGVTAYTYNANGDKLTETDPLGRTTTYAHDPDRRLQSVTDAMGGVTSYAYDASGDETAVTDANGHTTTKTYNALNYLVSQADPLGDTQTFTYDAVGNVASFTDANGHTTSYQYDALYRPVRVTDPAGNVTAFTYDLYGDRLSATDPNGTTTSYSYNARHQVLQQTDALGGVMRFGYDSVGNETSVTDERGNKTTFAYDTLDRRVSMTDATGATWGNSYYPNDKPATSTDPLGAVTHYAYDNLDRLTAMTDPLGGLWQYGYDAVGNPTSMTDPLSRTTRMTFDALNRETSMTDPLGSVTHYGYDAAGNRTSLTDPDGNVTQFVFDAANRLVQQTDPLGHSAFFGYDPVGNLVRTTDRDGRLTTFAYDTLDRRTGETWWNGSTAVNTIQYTYDSIGNLLSAGDAFSHYTFTYDALTRQTSSDNAGTPGAPHVVLTFAYDAASNRTSVQDNSGVVVSSSYDPRNLLASQTWSGTGVDPARVNFTYNPRGDRTATQRYSDLTGTNLVSSSAYTHDANGRLTEIKHSDPTGAVLADYQYVLDPANQLVSETDHGQAFTYAHDLAGQLTSATSTSQPGESYTYDANGNRTGGGYVVGPDNQVLSDGTFNYTYDAEGNLTRKTTIATGQYTDFQYDYRNRLVQGTVTSAGGIILSQVTYTYDVFNRRIARTVDPDGAGPQPAVTTYTVYDGANAWADYSASGQVLARYLFGQGADEILARFRPGEGTAWYLTDRLGSVRDIVNAAGVVIDHLDYDSFGNILRQTNPAAGDRFTFTGREWDPQLQLYYYRARFYDPQQGRFVSQDPTGFSAGDTNLYRYVGNSPLGATDPSGNLAITECAILKAVRVLTALACPVADLWASGALASNEPDVQVDNALSLLQAAGSILPAGGGLPFQITMRALTAKTSLDVIVPFMGPFVGMGMAVYGVYDAWQQSQKPNGSSKLFWVRLICTAAEFGLMVWAARAKCFVAGTPVLIGYAPDGPPPDDEGVLAALLEGELPDRIGEVALLVGMAALAAHLARRPHSGKQGKRTRALSTEPLDGDAPLPDPDLGGCDPGDDDSHDHYPLVGSARPPDHPTLPRRPEWTELAEPSTAAAVLDSPQTASALDTTARHGEAPPAMAKPKRRFGFLPLLALASFLTAGVCFLPRLAHLGRTTEPAGVAAARPAAGKQLVTRPIEEVEVGDRVAGQNPLPEEAERIGPDPETWRKVRLHLTKKDGRSLWVELLRPVDWIGYYDARPGSRVPLDLEDLGAVGDAEVIAVGPCPEIKPGPGAVVTGKFAHQSDGSHTVELRLEGQEEATGVTDTHPYWSVDRRAFVPVGELRRGEHVDTERGVRAVVSITPLPYTGFLYNLETTEHVYRIGSLGTLSHNACTPLISTDRRGRTRSAYAHLRPADLNSGTGTNQASRRQARSQGNANDDAGHLIGRLLGGPGSAGSGNTFPQDPTINRGQYRQYERTIADQLRAGNDVFVRVTLRYPGNSTRPSGVVYDVRVNGVAWPTRTFGN